MIAVVGGSGVYARHLIPRLVAAGHRVRALVRRPERARVALACGAEVRRADLFDCASLAIFAPASRAEQRAQRLACAGAALSISFSSSFSGCIESPMYVNHAT